MDITIILLFKLVKYKIVWLKTTLWIDLFILEQIEYIFAIISLFKLVKYKIVWLNTIIGIDLFILQHIEYIFYNN
jgi:hypothetical protein